MIPTTQEAIQNPDTLKPKVKTVIRCQNCKYEGLAEFARQPFFELLAWLGVLLTPLITVIYYLATHKWRCPKCKSILVEIKNKNGVFISPKSHRRAKNFIFYFIGAMIIMVLLSVLLASLNTSRPSDVDTRVDRPSPPRLPHAPAL